MQTHSSAIRRIEMGLRRTIGLALAGLAFCVSAIAFAQVPGALDTTFALGNGKLPAIGIGTAPSRAQATAIQPDGKIIAAGYCSNGSNNDFCVMRLNADGTADPTFVGPGGKLVLAIGSGNDFVHDVAVQPDGKIVLLGRCSNGTNIDFCFARLLSNGTLDATFTGPVNTASGSFLIAIGSADDNASALALQPDGKIIGVGSCVGASNIDFCVVRLNGDGSLDTTFNVPGDGKLLLPIGAASDFGNAVALQSDGKLLVVGGCSVSAQSDFCAARLNLDGTLDGSFVGPNNTATGSFTFPIGIAGDSATAVAVQPDGKIVIAGSCLNSNKFEHCVARLTTTGAYDANFKGPSGTANGRFQFPVTLGTGNDPVSAVAITVDGKILLMGGCTSDFCITRLNVDGSFDSSFDGISGTSDGKVIHPIGPATDNMIRGALHADGRAVMVGGCLDSTPTENFCVARVNGGPMSYRACSFDVDGDNLVLATTDVLVAARVALGMRGSNVISGINFPAGATRNTWPLIRDYLFNQCGMSVY
jgi:uncharacterized delta-60 repeat protein